jgi:hypothetical protein
MSDPQPPTPPAPPAVPPAPTPPVPPVPTPPPAPADPGFPANTPIEQMTLEQREAYWKHYARQHEQRLREANVPELQRQAAEYQALLAATQTDAEKAIAAARAEGHAAAMRQASTAMVDAYLTAASAGRLGEEQRLALLEGVDRAAFLAADGSVDTAKVTAWINRIAPGAAPGAPGAPGTPQRIDTGQGTRPHTPGATGLEAGRAEARRRFPKAGAGA